MGAGLNAVLGFAVGVAISPIPIIAVILMLFSPRARANGVAFAAGWVVALAVVSTAAYLLVDAGARSSAGTTTTTIAWAKLVLGLVLLALAVRRWGTRPSPGAPAPMPRWMEGIDGLAPGKALGLGVLLAGVNPKNLVLAVSAGAGVAQLSLPTGQTVVSLVVFVTVASLTIVVPVGYYLVGGTTATTSLDALKDWLTVHNSAVMAVLLLVFGVDLVGQGLSPLF